MKKHVSILLGLLALVAVSTASAGYCPPGGTQEICSDSADLNLSGEVPIFCDIEVLADAAATDLDIVGGEAGTKVATVVESSNNPGGYDVSVSSANNGSLENGTDSVPYQISYDGGPLVAPTAAPAVVKSSGPLAGAVVDNSDVEITFAGAGATSAGVYTDTLTFTLTAL